MSKNKNKHKRSRRRPGTGSNPGIPNGYNQSSSQMDFKREMLQDTILVPWSNLNGNLVMQAGVNEIAFFDSGDSSSMAFPYGSATS